LTKQALILTALTGMFSALSAMAQTSLPVSQEVRDLATELQAGETLQAPAGATNQPQSVTETEPANNGFGAATMVSIDGTASGLIGKKGDVDFWRVRAPRRGALSVRSSAVPPEVDLAVRLWDANRDALSGWVAAPKPGGAIETVFDLPAGGDYRLEIRDGRNDASSDATYRVALEFTPVPETAEPNDTIGQATRAPIDSAFMASILPKGDVDWILVMADDQGELNVRVATPPDNLDLAVRLWNADGEAITGWVSALAVGGPLNASFDVARPGQYLLELRDGHNDARSAVPFEVALNLRPTGERGEPNDSIRTATPLQFEDTVAATILPKGDADWYAIDAEVPGELTVSLTQPPTNLDLNFRLWDGDAKAITGWFAPLAVGGENINIVDLGRPGRYLIEVRDGRNDQRSAEPYRIGATFVPAADRGEPNDTLGRTTALTIDEPYRANILPKGDADFYEVTVSEQAAMTVSLTESPENLDLSLRVWNPSLQAMTGWFGPLAMGGDTTQVVDIGVPGRYAIEVRDGRNDARASAPYTITVTLEKSGDAFEPNDRVGKASRIGLGDPVNGSILPKGDADWYRVDLGQAGVLRAAISGVPDALDVSVRFWNADVKAISGWTGPLAKGGPVEAEVNVKTPGAYFVEVRDGRNDGRAVAPYTLTVTAFAE